MFNTIIGVDTGNDAIKTKNFTFPSGLSESMESFPTGDNLKYQGKYYTAISKRTTYKKDKSVDDTYFILTLIAIAKEIEYRYQNGGDMFEIHLATGLPPAHYRTKGIKDKYAAYFKTGELVEFEFNEKPYLIQIGAVGVYPQAYAAAIPHFRELMDLQEAYLLDMGGYTSDVLLMKSGIPDMSVCESFDFGTIIFYTNVKDKVNSEFEYTLSDLEINAVLRQDKSFLPVEMQQRITTLAEEYIRDFFLLVNEKKISLKYKPTYLIGGGSLLFQKNIENGGYLAHHTWIPSINANALGYEMLQKRQVI